ncbi:MAG TPA: CRTAC1 family protein [Pirellulales bacterium]|jgi:hypothetical protein|nr:CRTAC1 family protein [Pirellulales bacterium]
MSTNFERRGSMPAPSKRSRQVVVLGLLFLAPAVVLLVVSRSSRRGWRDGADAFRDEARESGIDFRMTFLPNEQGEHFKVNLYDHGCGLAVADYDGDGDDDVLFLNQLGGNALYRNRGDGTFDNVTAAAGPLSLTDRICVGAAFGDYDNDDDQDLYVTSTRGGNVLFENQGDGTFRDVTDRSGAAWVAHSQTPAFFDYDNDGYLDLFVSNTARWTDEAIDPQAGYFPGAGDLLEHVVNADDWEPNVLFHNDANGRFTNVTEEAGVAGHGWGGDVAVFDCDEDGDLDLVITNMFGMSRLYRNDGRGHFDDDTSETLGRTPFGAIGCKAFDFDGDGRLDLFIADMHSDMWYRPEFGYPIEPRVKYPNFMGPDLESHPLQLRAEKAFLDFFHLSYDSLLFGNALFRNDGGGRFTEVSDAAGLETWWPWGVAVGDFDADGHEDLFLPSGMGYPYFYWPSCLMHNDGDGRFTDIADQAGIEAPVDGTHLAQHIGGHPAARSSRCAATADFDGDGRLELIVNNFNDRPYYFKNHFPQRHYLAVRLRGTTSNHDAVGALVKLFVDGRVMVRQVHCSGGYLSQSSKTLHFGLSDHDRVDRAEIVWPSGLLQTIDSPAVDRLHEITEPATAPSRNLQSSR